MLCNKITKKQNNNGLSNCNKNKNMHSKKQNKKCYDAYFNSISWISQMQIKTYLERNYKTKESKIYIHFEFFMLWRDCLITKLFESNWVYWLMLSEH